MCDVKATLPGAELKPTRPQPSGRHESGDALPYGERQRPASEAHTTARATSAEAETETERCVEQSERQRPASEALAAIQSDYVVRCAAEALLNPPACDLSGE